LGVGERKRAKEVGGWRGGEREALQTKVDGGEGR